MARRAHQQTSPSLGIWLIGFLLVLGILGAFFLQNDTTPYRPLAPPLPADYLENANSLRGNVYRLEGVISSSLGWSQEKGRLFSLKVSQGDKDCPLPILVPSTYQELNLQKGQRYRVKVRVNDQGLLKVEEMTKA